jgi:energy-converting hydrogenase Eha subunit F
VKRLWRTSPELIATAALMTCVLAGAIVGLVIDPRTVTGMPAWLKPAKFAVSVAIYTVTLAWIFTVIPAWTRTRRMIGWMTAIVMVLEVGIISTQAWRGTTSHFNVGTLLDTVLFTVMGLAIVVQTLSTVAVAIALWRQPFDDRSWAWVLRFGMTLTIVGALTGGLMTRPTSAQLEAARAGEPMTVAGAHTVGAPDGGPGLAGTGWSTEHGDLRVPHLVGLHAIQALALLAMIMTHAGVRQSVRTRLLLVAGPSYGALYAILLVQALRGIPLAAPDATTVTHLGMWAVATAVAAVIAMRSDVRLVRHTVGIQGER